MNPSFYQPLQQSLQESTASMGIAEVHGVLCGVLCTPEHIPEDRWLELIFSENNDESLLIADCRKQPILLKEYTVTQLNSSDCRFNLLVPTDEQPLVERTQALAEWCQGFLLGLGLTPTIQQRELTNTLKEFMRDVILISHLDPPEQDTETDEKAYAELVEYLRMGILTFYQEFTGNSN